MITADDPASRARMKMLPAADEQPNGGPQLRTVEWNDAGEVVRDEGGRKPVTVKSSGGPVESPEPSARYDRSGSAGLTMLKWLMWLGLTAFALWLWRRSRRSAATRPVDRVRPPSAVNPSPEPKVASAIADAPMAFRTQLADLSALAAITDCEPLVVALHRYGREVQNLARIRFDADLADEIRAIVEHHLDHAIDRYRQVRTSLDGEDGARADAMLTQAIECLALRLQELQAEQQHRDVDGVDEAVRFIDARHPR